MFRKSALAMAMLGALTTGNVVALGLGEIELKSALNQPLNAEVELLSATDAELAELKVEIGSAQAFENAGIDRPLFLTKLNFSVKTNSDGKPVVRITSRDVVREPFLDFLLEISWSRGRLLREYTVLIDPPVTMPAAAPVTQAPAVRAAAPSPQPAPIQPARRVTHTAQMPPVSTGPGEYLTKRNDTLWRVAEQVRPDAGVSMEQTMLGLLRANPEAFYNNNINNLKAGYILRVPDREEMTSISKAEASREARAQYAEWRETRGLPKAATPEGGAAAGASDAAVEAKSSLQLVAADSAEAGGADASAEAAAELQTMQRELMMANEALEAQRRQGEEMSDRLTVLEEQIVNMQRLIQLKDNELARLQAQAAGTDPLEQLADTGEQAVPAETDVSEALPAEEGVEALTDVEPGPAGLDEGVEAVDTLAAADPLGVESAVDEVPVDEPMLGEMPLPDTGVSEAETGGAAVDQAVEEMTAGVEPEPAVSEPAVPETAPAPGLVDRVLANPLWLGAGGVVIALLAFFGLRRKRGVETEFQESILQAAQGVSVDAGDSELVVPEPVSSETTSSQSSLLSEFAVSDMGAMKNDGEADPLAEADVYLAYGRFQQAEDLIKEALEKDATREDLNLKLLEVYLAGRNQAAFDEHAQSVLALLQDSDNPTWEKVAEMGRELSPANPLYQAGGAAAVAEDQTVRMDSPDQDMEFTTDEGVAEAEQPATADEGLDFDIDLSFDTTESSSEEQPESVEFTPPEDLAEQPEVSEPKLDIDMDSIEPETLDQGGELEFDLEGFDLGGEEPVTADVEPDGELADLDEVSTKLDLARAYIDMGDPDGAKSILDEVMDEGSDDQKNEARGILEQMS